jgi:HEAT repeat protein
MTTRLSWFAFLALLLLAPAAAQNAHIARLAEELESTNVAIRRQAAKSLGRVGQPLSITLLSSAMQTEENVSIRLEIVRALRNIAFLRDPGFRQALGAIANAADQAQEEDMLVRLRATEALWEAGRKDLLDPVPFLDRGLSDPSPRLRLSAVQMLRKLGTAETIDPLGRAANDPDQPDTIRLRAIEAIGAVALMDLGPVGREVAEANVFTTDLVGVAPLVDTKAITRRHEKQIGYLATVVRDSDNTPTLVLRAVKSMGQVKDKSSIPVLREVIETHRNQAVRKQATRVLSHVLARQYE